MFAQSARFVYDRSMLSYRHAFHAGNHADVLKHVVLMECLRLLGRKEKGFLVADTHAGAGDYALEEGYAAQNREWESGVARLRNSDPAPGAVASYLKLVSAYGDGNAGRYPGSPAIAAALLREQDRAVFCELHPTDHAALEERFAGNRAVRVRKTDGFAELKALLPPPTRRGLVFIDPSYELASDYALLVDALKDSLRRFADGVYVVWYPLLEREEARKLPERLGALGAAATLNAALRVRASAPGERGMSGSGVFVVNPPWKLKETLEETLPFLARTLAADAGAGWKLDARY